MAGDPGGQLPVGARLPLLVLAGVAAATGVLGGLVRLGWVLPVRADAPVAHHGALMVGAFFGTVIGLERAVAIRSRWAYMAPLLSGLAAPALIHGYTEAGQWLLAAGSAGLLLASGRVFHRHRAAFTGVITLAAAIWLAGNLAWIGGARLATVVPSWLAFLVLTIAGERLELSRLLPPSRIGAWSFGAIIMTSLVGLAPGFERFFAASLLGLAVWLLRFDIARTTIGQAGLPRFVAACLLSGFGWLAVGAAGALWSGGFVLGTSGGDASLHAIFLGFVFSMVFGHAPIILPAVLGVRLAYSPLMYLPLAVLHSSVALRVAAAWFGSPALRANAGLANAAALVLFAVGTIAAAVAGSRHSARAPGG